MKFKKLNILILTFIVIISVPNISNAQSLLGKKNTAIALPLDSGEFALRKARFNSLKISLEKEGNIVNEIIIESKNCLVILVLDENNKNSSLYVMTLLDVVGCLATYIVDKDKHSSDFLTAQQVKYSGLYKINLHTTLSFTLDEEVTKLSEMDIHSYQMIQINY